MPVSGITDQDVERSKQAAHDALQQLGLYLGFCIGFLAGANNGKAAGPFARNRA